MPSPLSALAFAANTTRLSTFDLALVAVYLVAITLFGLRFREKKGGAKADKSLKSYFLANNTIPWWAIALSIVSAETSTLTIISIPGVAFAGDFGFLQIVLGYMLGRIVVAVLFLPRYFAGDMLTAYQLIDQRFGPTLHKVTAGLFLLTRAAAEGVRVFAISIVVGIAIGTGDRLSIGIICALTLLYTFEGGMAAVIWTDVVQMFIYVAGTLVALWSLGHHIPGGWFDPNIGILAYTSHLGKLRVFNFALNLTQSYTFWAGILGGTFLTMASHGTDQLMVQRMLAARNLRESRLALLSSGIVIFLQFSFFLLIGAGLFVFYLRPDTETMGRVAANAQWLHGMSTDRIFPTYIVKEMPIGIAGLLVAAILAAAMSNLSAALNSLSSTTVVDFYMHVRPNADERERAIISKSSTVFWALVLFAIAVATVTVGGKGHVVEIALSIASVAYGCLLGVFLLGTLTKYATEVGTAIGMVCGFILNIWLWQGNFPKTFFAAHCPDGVDFKDCLPASGITIPHIAFTWYVLIGAIVTFAIGSLASLIFRKQSRRTLTAAATAALLPLLCCLSFRGAAEEPASRPAAALISTPSPSPASRPKKSKHQKQPKHKPLAADFSSVATLMNDAIAAHKLPGAVVIVGHDADIVFHQAFGNRKLDGEPGLDGNPSPAEPMTEDTIFDMASLTKDLATATSIMQLYEAGKIDSFDDPIQKYFPDFNADNDPIRAKVTLRMMLTHTSGEGPDIALKDPWGLDAPDKAEGLRRALSTPLKDPPASKFLYSDINFILLGALVEKLSGQSEDVYVTQHIYQPLGMTDTRYLPFAKACGPHNTVGAAITWAPKPPGRIAYACPAGTWSTSLLERIAPTTHDDEGNATTNSHFNLLTRGTVHDPTTRRMGGVAGHAGLFSTAPDVALYAQAFLDKLLRNTGPFPLKQSTLQLMIQPEQPGANLSQLVAANLATEAAIRADDASCCAAKNQDPLLAPAYPAIKGQDLRGFGWDIDTAFSKPRGRIFPIGSFGHTGFTGTTLWIDPASDTYYVLLANAVHPRGGLPISPLRGEVATTVARALHLYNSSPTPPAQSSSPLPKGIGNEPYGPVARGGPSLAPSAKSGVSGAARPLSSNPPTSPQTRAEQLKQFDRLSDYSGPTRPHTLTGIDVLESTQFAALAPIAAKHSNHLNLALLTNQAGIDANRRRTIDILHTDLPAAIPTAHLTTLFSPEHGMFALSDTVHIGPEVEPATGLHVTSLYGPKDSDKRPTHDQLANIDAVIIDLQDAGTHFWTYESVLGYFLEAASREKSEFHHDLDIIVLDRPSLAGGMAVQGPVSDPGLESYTNYMPSPIRHGMTYGELARYFNKYKLTPTGQPLNASLTVIAMQHWTRGEYFDDTHLPWVNPSPNLRDSTAAILYFAFGFIESTNISVGRGTDSPFHVFGAGVPTNDPITHQPRPAWFNAADVVAALTARNIPGVTFAPTAIPVVEDSNKYPYHGQIMPAVRVTLTDRNALDSPELGVEILSVLHHLYPTQFLYTHSQRLIYSQSTTDALTRGDDPHTIAATWQPALDTFKANRATVLLY